MPKSPCSHTRSQATSFFSKLQLPRSLIATLTLVIKNAIRGHLMVSGILPHRAHHIARFQAATSKNGIAALFQRPIDSRVQLNSSRGHSFPLPLLLAV